jgi:hypothetical protein
MRRGERGEGRGEKIFYHQDTKDTKVGEERRVKSEE